MKTKGITIIEAVVLVITTAVLAMAMLSFSVNAEELASSTSNSILQSYKHEKDPVSIKPASDNSTTTKSTMTKADILKQSGVPGKGIDHAPGLQKPFNPNSNASENAGMKNGPHYNPTSDNHTSPPFSDNRTMIRTEMLKQSGPGKGNDHTPGLQKLFNPSSNTAENAGMKKFFSNWQHRFQEMIRRYFGKTR